MDLDISVNCISRQHFRVGFDRLCYASTSQYCHSRGILCGNRHDWLHWWWRRTDIQGSHGRPGLFTWWLLPWNVVLNLAVWRCNLWIHRSWNFTRHILRPWLAFVLQQIYSGLRLDWIRSLEWRNRFHFRHRLLQSGRLQGILALHLELEQQLVPVEHEHLSTHQRHSR